MWLPKPDRSANRNPMLSVIRPMYSLGKRSTLMALPTKERCMNRVISGFLVMLAIVISAAFGPLVVPAHAAPTTPEATKYQVDRGNTEIRINPESSQTSAKGSDGGVIDSLQNAGEAVRDKLNLNEPLPEGTKAFFKQVRGEDVTVEEPRPSGKGQAPENH